MYHPRLYGNFYDMGLKYGSLLYEKAGFQIPAMSKERTQFGIESYEILKTFYPEIIEEIEGFAEGIKAEPTLVGGFLLSIGIFDMSAQCTAFAYKNDDSVLIGRNFDMLFTFKKYSQSSLTAPAGKNAHISHSDAFIGCEDGINEKGLAMAMTFVDGTSTRPGVGFYFIVRRVLEECATVEEAIAVIKAAKVSKANNFLIADKQGGMAVVESAPEKTVTRYPAAGENFVFTTNQFMSKEMQAYDTARVDWSKSRERYESVGRQLKERGELSFENVKEVLSDRCVCLDLKKHKFGTIWSIVANLATLRIERAEAKPKINNYRPETRLDCGLEKKKSSEI